MEKYNEQLKNFLSSLDRRSAKKARGLMAEACKIPTKRIYNWTNAGTKITALERETIEQSLKAKVFEE